MSDRYIEVRVGNARAFQDMQKVEATVAFVDYVTGTIYLYENSIKIKDGKPCQM